MELGVEIIKIASSDGNDWVLIEKIATTRKPVIVSTGGSSLKDIDDLVTFFEHRNIPLAINHCVSLYPTEDGDLALNQIDFMVRRYPNHVIGFSTHEYHDWTTVYPDRVRQGCADVRTAHRHRGRRHPRVAVLLPPAPGRHLVQGLEEGEGDVRAVRRDLARPPRAEIEYLDALVRGVYATRDLPAGHALTDDDVYLAIPLQKGQISCRELMRGEIVLTDIAADEPIGIDDIDSPYATNPSLRQMIEERGI